MLLWISLYSYTCIFLPTHTCVCTCICIYTYSFSHVYTHLFLWIDMVVGLLGMPVFRKNMVRIALIVWLFALGLFVDVLYPIKDFSVLRVIFFLFTFKKIRMNGWTSSNAYYVSGEMRVWFYPSFFQCVHCNDCC